MTAEPRVPATAPAGWRSQKVVLVLGDRREVCLLRWHADDRQRHVRLAAWDSHHEGAGADLYEAMRDLHGKLVHARCPAGGSLN